MAPKPDPSTALAPSSTVSDRGDGGHLDHTGDPGADGGWFGRWRADQDGVPSFELDPSVEVSALVTPDGDWRSVWHQVANAGITALAHGGGWTSLWVANRGVVQLTDRTSWWGRPATPTTDLRATWAPGAVAWHARSGDTRVRRRMAAHSGGLPVLRIDVELDDVGVGDCWEERWLPAPVPLVVGALMSPAEPPPHDLEPRRRLAWRATFAASAVSRRATWALRRRLGPRLFRAPYFHPGLVAVVHPPRFDVTDRPAASSAAWIDLSLPSLFVAYVDGDGMVGARVDHGALVVGLDPRATRQARQAREERRPAVAEPDDASGRRAAGDGPPEDPIQERDRGPVRLTFAVGVAANEQELRRLVAAVRADEPAVQRERLASLIELRALDVPTAPTAATAASTATRPAPPDRGDPAHTASAAPVPDPQLAGLAREARWHAAYLHGAAQHDDHFGRRYIAQGSAYGFVHGLQGAPRDYALFAAPMSYLDPALAAEQLEVMLRMQRPDGALAYAHTGRGRCTDGGIHAAPSDLPLWLLWAVTDHIWVTGDRSLLDVVVPWCPAPAQPASPVRDHLVAAARYLLDGVGRGPNGLVRVGSGDWADPISAMVPDRSAFHRDGESTFNTGFACYVLPRVATLLAPDVPELAAELRTVSDELRASLDAAWTGRWWRRGFDGRGGTLGDQHLFVDGQVWPIIAGIGATAQRRRVVDEIVDRCQAPSPIGATILDRPHEVRFGMLAPGWDCNGGVWAAVNALLAWAEATVDADAAWTCLADQSLATHARAYPHLWYGIWSGPDAYNAWFGSRAGETFVQPATPMREFPVMNANAHAGPLLALLRVLGVEATPDGPVVQDRGGHVAPWSLRLGGGLELRSPRRAP